MTQRTSNRSRRRANTSQTKDNVTPISDEALFSGQMHEVVALWSNETALAENADARAVYCLVEAFAKGVKFQCKDSVELDTLDWPLKKTAKATPNEMYNAVLKLGGVNTSPKRSEFSSTEDFQDAKRKLEALRQKFRRIRYIAVALCHEHKADRKNALASIQLSNDGSLLFSTESKVFAFIRPANKSQGLIAVSVNEAAKACRDYCVKHRLAPSNTRAKHGEKKKAEAETAFVKLKASEMAVAFYDRIRKTNRWTSDMEEIGSLILAELLHHFAFDKKTKGLDIEKAKQFFIDQKTAPNANQTDAAKKSAA